MEKDVKELLVRSTDRHLRAGGCEEQESDEVGDHHGLRSACGV